MALSDVYAVQNVIPLNLKVSAVSGVSSISPYDPESRCHLAYDADHIILSDVAGGFNSVVEISAGFCRRFISLTPDNVEVAISASDLQTFIREQETPFESSFLNNFQASTIPANLCQIRLTFEPVDFRFEDANKVCVTYRGDLALYKGEWSGEMEEIHRDVRHRREVTPEEGVPLEDVITVLRFQSPASAGGHVHWKIDWELLYRIGYLTLTLRCDYASESAPDLTEVTAFADLTTATIEVDAPAGDVQRFYDHFLAESQASVERSLTEQARVSLAPTISLVGSNPSNQPVTEMEDFAAHVFHVDRESCQALAFAFDVQPGHHGTIEDVQHFIGNRDYGVISDQYLIERLFKHKWRLGGFYRNLRAEAAIKVVRDSEEEDATLEGEVQLISLDQVEIDVEPDLRTDVVRLAGLATVTGGQIRLTDGTTIGLDELDWGGPEDFGWSINMSPQAEPILSPHPELLEFLRLASRDGYKHVAKPFSSSAQQDAMRVVYSRLEGIGNQVFILGYR